MLVKGGRIVDPSQGLDALLDLRIEGSRVAEIGEHLEPQRGEDVLDASGAFVSPGFIDMHVHLREPGNPEKETIATGTAAAVAGGFTAVAAMPNTSPPIDSAQWVRFLSHPEASKDPEEAKGAHCRVYPIACITKNRAGESPVDFAGLAKAGAVAFSDDGSTVMNANVVYDAAVAARDVPGCFIVHCEDVHLKGTSFRNAGSNAIAEDVLVARDAIIAQHTRKAWHIAHLSTRGALQAVLDARARGVNLTCEVTPHHLVFTDAAVDRLGSGGKVNPPLRSQADVDALRSAVLNGSVDAFATDHAPHTHEEKSADISCGAVGFTGLEVAAGAYAHALPGLPVSRFVEMISVNPARILNVRGGTLAPGSMADVSIFADRSWTVDPQTFRSKGKSTPFSGMTLPRQVLATIVNGVLAFQR